MRSLASTLMSLGGIAVSFGVVVFILMVLAKANSHPGIAERTTLGLMAVLAGGGLIVLGFLMSRMGRKTSQ